MARNAPVPPPRRRLRSERSHAAVPAPGAGPVGAEVLPDDAATDDARTVYSWLCRFTDDPAECERLLVDILRRSRSAPPVWLRSASTATRLQFLTVEGVLRLRGVL